VLHGLLVVVLHLLLPYPLRNLRLYLLSQNDAAISLRVEGHLDFASPLNASAWSLRSI